MFDHLRSLLLPCAQFRCLLVALQVRSPLFAGSIALVASCVGSFVVLVYSVRCMAVVSMGSLFLVYVRAPDTHEIEYVYLGGQCEQKLRGS